MVTFRDNEIISTTPAETRRKSEVEAVSIFSKRQPLATEPSPYTQFAAESPKWCSAKLDEKQIANPVGSNIQIRSLLEKVDQTYNTQQARRQVQPSVSLKTLRSPMRPESGFGLSSKSGRIVSTQRIQRPQLQCKTVRPSAKSIPRFTSAVHNLTSE